MSNSRPGRRALAWILAPLVLALGACAAEPQPVPGLPAPEGLTDANITSVTQSYNTGEVRIAQLATSRATNQAVKNFAQKVAHDHNQSNTALNAVLSAQRIQPAAYRATTEIEEREAKSYASLQDRSGMAFDRAYLDAEINHHRWVISQLDNNLIPGAKDAALRKYLTELRATEASHLAEAEEIRSRLGGNDR